MKAVCEARPAGGDGSAWCHEKPQHKGLHVTQFRQAFSKIERRPTPAQRAAKKYGRCYWCDALRLKKNLKRTTLAGPAHRRVYCCREPVCPTTT